MNCVEIGALKSQIKTITSYVGNAALWSDKRSLTDQAVSTTYIRTCMSDHTACRQSQKRAIVVIRVARAACGRRKRKKEEKFMIASMTRMISMFEGCCSWDLFEYSVQCADW
jgi:hypothetical protein